MKEALVRIRKRASEESPEALVQRLQPRLERAALADIQCDPLETTLVPWTLDSIRPHAAHPAVRAELERLAKGYIPAEKVTTAFASLQDRLRAYAARLMGSPAR